MDQVNLLCETENCGKAARVFGLKGSLKIRSCEPHMSSLLFKSMQIIGIAAYRFVSTSMDVVIFEERLAQVEKARGILAVLDATCESELTSALQDIEKAKGNVMREVELRFEEIKTVVTGVCDEKKRQISMLRGEMELFLASREVELPHVAVLKSAIVGAVPKLLKFGLADVTDYISAALSESWTVSTADVSSTLSYLDENQRDAAIKGALEEAANRAQKGLSDSLQYADLLIGDDVEYEKGKLEVLRNLLEFEKKTQEPKLKWLQRFWDLRQQYTFSDQTTITVGQKFAKLLYCAFGQFADADKALRYCHNLARKQDPLSEVSMSLCCETCGMYFVSGQYLQVEQLGMWILDTFGAVDLPAEYYWTTLLFLTCSMRKVSRKDEATAILEKWEKRVFCEQNKLSEMYRLLTFGIEAYYSDNQEQATQCLSSARRIGLSHFPTSPFTALSLYYFALARGGRSEEQYYLQALSIYEVVAPKSVLAAVSLYKMGCFFTRKLHKNEITAIYYFKQAQFIYETVAPKSVKAAHNLHNLGNLLSQEGKQSEALQCYQKAQYIFQVNEVKSDLAISNLLNLGQTFVDSGYMNEAIECFQQVHCMQEVNADTWSKAIDNLRKLANALSMTRGRWTESIDCYKMVQAAIEQFCPQSDLLPDNYMDMGKVFEENSNNAAAIECYIKAASLYKERGNQSWGKMAETKAAKLDKAEDLK